MPPRRPAPAPAPAPAAAPPISGGSRNELSLGESAEGESMITRSGARVSLKGRILTQDNERLVIEILLDQPIDWILTPEVGVTRGGSLQGIARVDQTRSTASGSYTPGLRLRLVLIHDEQLLAQPPHALLVTGFYIDLS